MVSNHTNRLFLLKKVLCAVSRLPLQSTWRVTNLRSVRLVTLDIITGSLQRDRWAVGCLIGDLSLEASFHSKRLRKRLDAIFQEWRTPFVSCIAAAQSAGEVDSKFDATELAEFLLASWQGAILRMKVERSPAALERFKSIVFETVFKKPGSTNIVARPISGRSATRGANQGRRRQAIRSKS